MAAPTPEEEVRRRWEAIDRNPGNLAAAARDLGLAPNTLRCWSYAVPRPPDPAIKDAMAAANTEMLPALAWVKTKNPDGTSYSILLKPDQHGQTFFDRVSEAFEGLTAALPVPAPLYSDSDLLTLYPIADLHLGMLAWERETGEAYDTALAAARVQSWVGQCVASSPASGTAVILGAGDLLHADDQTNQTPRNHHALDVDTRHFRTLEVAIAAIAACVELALQKHAQVKVVLLRGNHDEHAYMAVLFALAERYRSEPRVQVRKEPSEFWVHEHGACLLACHHGDKAPPDRIVLALADDHAEAWGRTRHRMLFTGHLHSFAGKDIGGVRWERLRAVTARDAYAKGSAWLNRAEMQGITFHRERGEVLRVKVGL